MPMPPLNLGYHLAYQHVCPIPHKEMGGGECANTGAWERRSRAPVLAYTVRGQFPQIVYNGPHNSQNFKAIIFIFYYYFHVIDMLRKQHKLLGTFIFKFAQCYRASKLTSSYIGYVTVYGHRPWNG